MSWTCRFLGPECFQNEWAPLPHFHPNLKLGGAEGGRVWVVGPSMKSCSYIWSTQQVWVSGCPWLHVHILSCVRTRAWLDEVSRPNLEHSFVYVSMLTVFHILSQSLNLGSVFPLFVSSPLSASLSYHWLLILASSSRCFSRLCARLPVFSTFCRTG